MTQVTQPTGGWLRQILIAENLAVAVPATGNTVLLIMPTLGMKNLGVEIKPTVHALDAFIIAARFGPNSDFVTLYSSAGQFTSPAGLLIGASGDLTALAAGATGWFVLDIRGLYEVRVSASSTTDGTLVDAYASAS